MIRWSHLGMRAPVPGVKNYKFDRPFLCHHYYILNLSDVCTSVKKKWNRNIVFSLYGPAMPHDPKLVIKFTIMVDSTLDIKT